MSLHSNIHSMKAKKVIRNATHYYLYQANEPKASFWKFDNVQKKSQCLEDFEVKNIDEETVQQCNALLDPSCKLAAIKRAVINRNRVIMFFDQEGNVVLKSTNYKGSIDIKSEANNLSLPKPHSLYDDLEEVKEEELTTNRDMLNMAFGDPYYYYFKTNKYKRGQRVKSAAKR